MRNARKALLPLLAALLAGGSLATPVTAAQLASAQPGQPPQPGAPRAVTVAYYRGDPLQGGQLLGTSTVTPGPGQRPFQDAPDGATYAVVTTPFGERVVNLGDARNQPGPGADARQPGPGRGGTGPDGAPPQRPPSQGQPGAPRGGNPDDAPRPPAPRGDLGPLGAALRGATRVTFYTADPLRGGQATGTITLGGTTGDQAAAIAQAARQARFAVVERPGERLIVDLAAVPGQPGQTPPQGTGRR